jgi:hypothetical protein
MTKMIAPWIVLVALVIAPLGAAFAQAGAGSAAPAQGAGPPAAGEPAPSAAGAPAPAAPAQPPVSDARAACTAAMNADPTFAAAIVKIADEAAVKKRDAATLEAHRAADHHVKKNMKHVIYAYAAMWVIAAGFVVFLWRRQQALKVEIAALRHDLEAAGDDVAKAPS